MVAVKLKVNSSSLERRKMNEGGKPVGVSVSLNAMTCQQIDRQLVRYAIPTCTKSIGVSSPASLLTLYLVVGKALGVM